MESPETSLHDSPHESVHVIAIEGSSATCHFIQYASSAPDVTLEAILLPTTDFGTDIIWRSHSCFC